MGRFPDGVKQQIGNRWPANQDIWQQRVLLVVPDRAAVDARDVETVGPGYRHGRRGVPLVEAAGVEVDVVLAGYDGGYLRAGAADRDQFGVYAGCYIFDQGAGPGTADYQA